MTKEEIQSLVEKEVSRRMADLTTQMGKDLSERFVTKQQLEDKITHRVQTEAKALQEQIAAVTRWIGQGEEVPEDHFAYPFVKLVEDSVDNSWRMMETTAYLLSDPKRLTWTHSQDEQKKLLDLRTMLSSQLKERLEGDLKSLFTDETSKFRSMLKLLVGDRGVE